MHHEIEIMTRRLELEKHRLKRMDKELEAEPCTQIGFLEGFLWGSWLRVGGGSWVASYTWSYKTANMGYKLSL